MHTLGYSHLLLPVASTKPLFSVGGAVTLKRQKLTYGQQNSCKSQTQHMSRCAVYLQH